ncbi:MAG TPA: SpoIIE family protein phosphatase, partial [Leptospiraceae bacterium]|nr:SpoIIE family protein phosphatase [Leptospiraceae bacterium]
MNLIDLENKQSILPDFNPDKKPIFSAYDCGKLALTAQKLIQENKFIFLNEKMRFQTLYEEYSENPELDFLPVFDSNTNEIIGYTMRQKILAELSKGPFSKELLLRPEVIVENIYDKRVLCIDAYTNLSEASYILMQREEDIRFDPFIITLDGYFYGICSIRKVLDGLNRFLEMDMSFCEISQLKLNLESNYNFSKQSSILSNYQINCLHGPGGDYVGTFSLNENLSLFIHLDVCGKGLKASNVLMVLGTIFKTWIEMETYIDRRYFKLSDKLFHLNHLAYRLTPDEMYATGVFILHDKLTQTIEVADFGHGFVWLKRGSKSARLTDFIPKEDEMEKIQQMPFFGINENFIVKTAKFKVKQGDLLFVCTDGIIEQKNIYKEEFGINRIEKVLSTYLGK